MKITVRNIDKEFERLAELQRNVFKKQGVISVENLVKDLKKATPIDTGLARASWTVSETKNGFNVTNNVNYIQYLNQGTSKQAPAYFVEAIALAYGKPQGTIVEVIPD